MQGSRPLFWLGLFWVYSSALWVFGVLSLTSSGSLLAAGILLAQMLGQLGIGIGLCACERWAWAPAFCLCLFYSVAAAIAAIWLFAVLASLPPGTLSWTPILLGMNSGACFRAALGACGILLVSVPNAVILWRLQEQFDVPERRPFSTLVRLGLAPMLALLGVHAYLLYGLWRAATES
jgi:hypothetical protein